MLDPELDGEKRAEVQSTMLGPKVLEAERYPEIRFRSTRAETHGAGKWVVAGELSIRDRTRPVRVTAEEGSDQHYRGTVTIRQKDFGIQPISLAGGTIKVKDEIRIEFDLVPQGGPAKAAAGGKAPAAGQAERREPLSTFEDGSRPGTMTEDFLPVCSSYAAITSSNA